jgi:hypothetical protein
MTKINTLQEQLNEEKENADALNGEIAHIENEKLEA